MSDDYKIEFTNNAEEVKKALGDACKQFLIDAGQIVKSQVRDLTRTDSTNLKTSYDYQITSDSGDMAVQIGSPLQNAIWEEFGTGEYALKGNGRKGGWLIPEEKLTANAKKKLKKKIIIKGKVYYCTKGKTPSRALHFAVKNSKPIIKKMAKDVYGGVFKG